MSPEVTTIPPEGTRERDLQLALWIVEGVVPEPVRQPVLWTEELVVELLGRQPAPLMGQGATAPLAGVAAAVRRVRQVIAACQVGRAAASAAVVVVAASAVVAAVVVAVVDAVAADAGNADFSI